MQLREAEELAEFEEKLQIDVDASSNQIDINQIAKSISLME